MAKAKVAVYELEVEGKKCLLSEIDLKTLEIVLGYLGAMNGRPQMITAGSIILENCWVSGDEELKTDDKYKAAACIAACGLVEVKQSTLKKI